MTTTATTFESNLAEADRHLAPLRPGADAAPDRRHPGGQQPRPLPIDGTPLGEIAAGTVEDISAADRAASLAFETWSQDRRRGTHRSSPPGGRRPRRRDGVGQLPQSPPPAVTVRRDTAQRDREGWGRLELRLPHGDQEHRQRYHPHPVTGPVADGLNRLAASAPIKQRTRTMRRDRSPGHPVQPATLAGRRPAAAGGTRAALPGGQEPAPQIRLRAGSGSCPSSGGPPGPGGHPPPRPSGTGRRWPP